LSCPPARSTSSRSARGHRLYPLEDRVRLTGLTSGGISRLANVAVAAARSTSAAQTRTGTDPFARFAHETVRLGARRLGHARRPPHHAAFCGSSCLITSAALRARRGATEMEIETAELDLTRSAGRRPLGDLSGLAREPVARHSAARGQGRRRFTVLDLTTGRHTDSAEAAGGRRRAWLRSTGRGQPRGGRSGGQSTLRGLRTRCSRRPGHRDREAGSGGSDRAHPRFACQGARHPGGHSQRPWCRRRLRGQPVPRAADRDASRQPAVVRRRRRRHRRQPPRVLHGNAHWPTWRRCWPARSRRPRCDGRRCVRHARRYAPRR
jgi:hypothetical protein